MQKLRNSTNPYFVWNRKKLTLQIKRKNQTGKLCLTPENWGATVSSKVATNSTTQPLGATTGFFFLESCKRNENKKVAGTLLTDLTQLWGCLSSADLCCLQNQVRTIYPTHGLMSRLHSKNPISAEASASGTPLALEHTDFWALNINSSLLIYHILHGQKEVSPKEGSSQISQKLKFTFKIQMRLPISFSWRQQEV